MSCRAERPVAPPGQLTSTPKRACVGGCMHGWERVWVGMCHKNTVGDAGSTARDYANTKSKQTHAVDAKPRKSSFQLQHHLWTTTPPRAHCLSQIVCFYLCFGDRLRQAPCISRVSLQGSCDNCGGSHDHGGLRCRTASWTGLSSLFVDCRIPCAVRPGPEPLHRQVWNTNPHEAESQQVASSTVYHIPRVMSALIVKLLSVLQFVVDAKPCLNAANSTSCPTGSN